MASSTKHSELKAWVQTIADLTTPDNIYWCDGSEAELEKMMSLLIDAGAAEKLNELFTGCMKGRTMYVIPFSMGPVGSHISKIGIEVTDSPYVVASMHTMTRVGQSALVNKMCLGRVI